MTAADPTYSRRWLILTVVGVAQVMVVLDATVVNNVRPQAGAPARATVHGNAVAFWAGAGVFAVGAVI